MERINLVMHEVATELQAKENCIAELHSQLEAERKEHARREAALVEANATLLSKIEDLSLTVSRLQAEVLSQTRSKNESLVAYVGSPRPKGFGAEGVDNAHRTPPHPSSGTSSVLDATLVNHGAAPVPQGSVHGVLATIDASLGHMRGAAASDLEHYRQRLLSRVRPAGASEPSRALPAAAPQYHPPSSVQLAGHSVEVGGGGGTGLTSAMNVTPPPLSSPAPAAPSAAAAAHASAAFDDAVRADLRSLLELTTASPAPVAQSRQPAAEEGRRGPPQHHPAAKTGTAAPPATGREASRERPAAAAAAASRPSSSGYAARAAATVGAKVTASGAPRDQARAPTRAAVAAPAGGGSADAAPARGAPQPHQQQQPHQPPSPPQQQDTRARRRSSLPSPTRASQPPQLQQRDSSSPPRSSLPGPGALHAQHAPSAFAPIAAAAAPALPLQPHAGAGGSSSGSSAVAIPRPDLRAAPYEERPSLPPPAAANSNGSSSSSGSRAPDDSGAPSSSGGAAAVVGGPPHSHNPSQGHAEAHPPQPPPAAAAPQRPEPQPASQSSPAPAPAEPVPTAPPAAPRAAATAAAAPPATVAPAAGGPEAPLSAPEFFALLRAQVPAPALAELMQALSDFNQRRLGKVGLMTVAKSVLATAVEPPLPRKGEARDLFLAFQQFMQRG